jgi:hypothetical protein
VPRSARCLRRAGRCARSERRRRGKSDTLDAHAVAAAEAGSHAFYVEGPSGERVEVTVARGARGRAYLTTRRGAGRPDDLLALPGFPGGARAHCPPPAGVAAAPPWPRPGPARPGRARPSS